MSSPSRRFPAAVEEVLLASGWRPDSQDRQDRPDRPDSQDRPELARARRWAVTLAAYATADGRQHTVVDAAVAAFAEFGGVRVDVDPAHAPGVEVARSGFLIEPLRALHSVRTLAAFGEALGVALTPLGVEDGGALLAIDAHGRVFVLDHTAEWFLGASPEEALCTLVLGRMPARVGEDGSWDSTPPSPIG
jgi:hypothetical protein